MIPKSEEELLEKAYKIAGKTLAELAQDKQHILPANLLHAKGFVGRLLEITLGATAGVKSEPDFQFIGVELKTIPIDRYGKPRETTYVCMVPSLSRGLIWYKSCVYQKLKRVLWIPYEADPDIEISKRRIGMPLLWSPTDEQSQILQQDWEELMELIAFGNIEQITAHRGIYLQIRPKAENNRALRKGVGTQGEIILTLPRGFYLRTALTQQVLAEHYLR